MGSFFAGVKAGTLAGLVYVGGLAAFNVFLLYLLKPEVISIITQSYAQVCTPTAGVNATTIAVEDCFSSVVVVYVPLIAFLGFFVSLVYAGVFGSLYELLPGKRADSKGVTMAVIVGFSLLLLNLTGIYFSVTAKVATVIAFVALTFVYGVVLGRLYRRYTREIQFISKDEKLLRILVGRRDYTGKTRTFAARSTHDIMAEVREGASFKEWSVSGGVKVEDARSYETTMEVEGDGILKGHAAAKNQ